MKTTILKMFASLLLAFTVSNSANAQNTKPVVVNDFKSTLINVPLTGNVLLNDYDIDQGQQLQDVHFITFPQHGHLVYDNGGDFQYTPNHNYFGNNYAEYVICDNGSPSLCDTGILSLNVLVNDYLTLRTCEKDYSLSMQNLSLEAGATYTLLQPSPYFTLNDNLLQVNAYPAVDTTMYFTIEKCIANICDTVFVYAYYNTCLNNEAFTTCSSTPVDIYHNNSPDNTIVAGFTPLNGTITIVNNTIVYTPNANFVGDDYCAFYYICGDSVPFTNHDGNIVMIATCDSIVAIIVVDDCLDLNTNVSGGILEGLVINTNPTNSTDWTLYENQVALRTGTTAPSQTTVFTQLMGNAIYKIVAGNEEVIIDNRIAGIRDLVNNANISVYPNPASDVLNISIKDSKYSIYELEVLDLTGKVVASQKFSNENISTNVSHLSTGLYTYQLKGNNAPIANGKVMIK